MSLNFTAFFEKQSEKKQFGIGFIFLLIGSLLGYIFQCRFDGILDLHIITHYTCFTALIDNILNTVILSIALFLLGKYLNSKTRVIDILNLSLTSRIPFYFLPLTNINNYGNYISNKMLKTFQKGETLNLSLPEIIYLAIDVAVSIASLILFFIILWLGFKIAVNPKNKYSLVLLITTVIIVEIITKPIIYLINP